MAKKIFGKMLDLIGLEETTLEEDDADMRYDDYDDYDDGYDDYGTSSYDDDYDYDDYDDAYEEKPRGLLGRRKQKEAAAPRQSARESRQSNSDSNVVGLPSSSGNKMKMIVYQPMTYDDTQSIIDNLKNRKPIIVNLESLELETAQRILDFMSGAVYALNGNIQKVSKGIFVLVPTNVDITGNIPDELKGKSFYTLGSKRKDY